MFTDRANPTEFTPDTASEYAEAGKIEEWVHAFLKGPGRNEGLSDGIKLQERYWKGPIEVSLSELARTCGPGLEYHEDEDLWQTRLTGIAEAIQSGTTMPPLIAEYLEGSLILRDGNHRCGGLEQIGQESYWVIIWYNSEADHAEDARPHTLSR